MAEKNNKVTSANPVTNQPGQAMQQQTTTTTVIINQQPNKSGGPEPLLFSNPREWSSGLCACGDDCSSCVCTYCCGWCYLCYMYSQFGENCCVACLSCGVPATGGPVCYFSPALFALRTAHRNRFGVRGTMCNDCCCTIWCPMCVQCQLKRDMNYVTNECDYPLFKSNLWKQDLCNLHFKFIEGALWLNKLFLYIFNYIIYKTVCVLRLIIPIIIAYLYVTFSTEL